jgi:hypothetical protein
MENNQEEGVLESSRAREIVSEILNFGVSELQIKKIIKMLSLELIDRSLMLDITAIIDENLDGNNTNAKTKIEI